MISIDLSVHELVDYALRSGSIENRSFNIFTMQEGTRLHAIYQNKQGSDYIKEVPLFSASEAEYFAFKTLNLVFL